MSSVGWVKPGDSYPFRIFVTNAMDDRGDQRQRDDRRAAVLDVPRRDAAQRRRHGDRRRAASITWNIGTIPAATEAGPHGPDARRRPRRAASLGADPEVVWKDLSTTATLTYTGQPAPITSTTHGPKVIPPDGGFDTARYGDKPFPIVPGRVRRPRAPEQRDLGQRRREARHGRQRPGLRWLDVQPLPGDELRPALPARHGAVGGHRLGRPSPTTARASTSRRRTGRTRSAAPRAAARRWPRRRAPSARPRFDTRISDGWYQLPGDDRVLRRRLARSSPRRRSASTAPAGRSARPSTTPRRSPIRRSTTTSTTPTRTASSTSSCSSSSAVAATAHRRSGRCTARTSPTTRRTTTSGPTRPALEAAVHRRGHRPPRLHQRRPAHEPRGGPAVLDRRATTCSPRTAPRTAAPVATTCRSSSASGRTTSTRRPSSRRPRSSATSTATTSACPTSTTTTASSTPT